MYMLEEVWGSGRIRREGEGLEESGRIRREVDGLEGKWKGSSSSFTRWGLLILASRTFLFNVPSCG